MQSFTLPFILQHQDPLWLYLKPIYEMPCSMNPEDYSRLSLMSKRTYLLTINWDETLFGFHSNKKHGRASVYTLLFHLFTSSLLDMSRYQAAPRGDINVCFFVYILPIYDLLRYILLWLKLEALKRRTKRNFISGSNPPGRENRYCSHEKMEAKEHIIKTSLKYSIVRCSYLSSDHLVHYTINSKKDTLESGRDDVLVIKDRYHIKVLVLIITNFYCWTMECLHRPSQIVVFIFTF